MDDKIYTTITLSLEDVDVVLNALAEKANNIQNLRMSIYNIANSQIPKNEEVKEEVEKSPRKKKGKNK